jgi:hypothetical protein
LAANFRACCRLSIGEASDWSVPERSVPKNRNANRQIRFMYTVEEIDINTKILFFSEAPL